MPAKYDKPMPITLMTDYYKIFHRMCFCPGTEQIVEYMTPRKSRIPYINYVVVVGVLYLVKKYFIDRFNVTFFERPWEEVKNEYMEYISNTFFEEIGAAEIEAFKKIYDLGYVPIEIRALPEGTRAPIGCPVMEFRCTEMWAHWLTGYMETISLSSTFLCMTDAAIAYENRQVVNRFYSETVEDDVPRSSAAGNFSMRGMAGEDAAMLADMAHLLSFSSTATVPTNMFLRNYYNAPLGVARGVPSLEHSVFESWGKEREYECFEYVATKVWPKGPLSMVCDTWDAWNVLDNYLPRLKDKISNRDGRILLRPDSGKPADIVCGANCEYIDVSKLEGDTEREKLERYFQARAAQDQDGTLAAKQYHVKTEHNMVEVTVSYMSKAGEPGKYIGEHALVAVSLRPKTTPEKGFVQRIAEICGYTLNSKGYRVLPSYIGVIYGDAITHDTMIEIYTRLAEAGYAANNIVMGIGAYTYQYVTRDTFGFALKATHGIVDGKETFMFKDPVTDKGEKSAGKKSQVGMCIVARDADGNITYTDHHYMAEADTPENLLRPIFRNGELLVDEDFETIRHRLNPDF